MYTTNPYGAVEYSNAKNGKEAPYDAAGNRAQYFKVSEFQCHNGEDSVWIQPTLVSALDALRRDFFQRALRVRSGYRSPAYNASLGGGGTAENSEHMYGSAADIEPSSRSGWSDRQWVADALALYRQRQLYGLTGVGLYDYSGGDIANSYIHVDTGAGSEAPSRKVGLVREMRPSFWYQWIRSPKDGETFAIYLYEPEKIANLLENLRGGGGDPTLYIQGLTGGETILGIQGQAASEDPPPSFAEHPQRTKLLQCYLQYKEGYTGSIDGVYGAETMAGVKRFQQRNGLTVDGVIGWNLGKTYPLMFPTLRYGQRDTDTAALTRNENVKFLQIILAERLGYVTFGEADGIFGVKTQEAVKEILGGGADGIVGPLTWERIADRL